MVPPKEDVMTYFRQLEERNYQAITSESTPKILGNVLKYLEKIRSTNRKIVKRLLQNVQIVVGKIINQILLFNKTQFVVTGPWTHIHLLDCRARRRIEGQYRA